MNKGFPEENDKDRLHVRRQRVSNIGLKVAVICIAVFTSMAISNSFSGHNNRDAYAQAVDDGSSIPQIPIPDVGGDDLTNVGETLDDNNNNTDDGDGGANDSNNTSSGNGASTGQDNDTNSTSSTGGTSTGESGANTHNSDFVPIIFEPNQSSTGCLTYDRPEGRLEVSCDTNISDLFFGLRDDAILQSVGNGQLLLKSNITVTDGATLSLDAKDGINYLKIADKNGIRVEGKIKIDGMKITSWNTTSDKVIDQDPRSANIPRAYISLRGSEGGSIVNSDISYLGYNRTGYRGIDFLDGSHSFVIDNSTFHDIWYGFYSNGAYNVTIRSSTYYDNLKYSIDPHTTTHDMLIMDNLVYNNPIGIVCSLDCYNITITGNTVHDNEGAGIFLSRNTHNSTVYNNTIYDQETGVSVSESNNNQIYGNDIRTERRGIYLRNPDNPDDGFTTSNNVYNNTISGANFGVVAVSSSGNTLSNNAFSSIGDYEYYLDGGSSLEIRNQTFSDARVGSEAPDAVIADATDDLDDEDEGDTGVPNNTGNFTNTIIIVDSGTIKVNANMTFDTDDSEYSDAVLPNRTMTIDSIR